MTKLAISILNVKDKYLSVIEEINNTSADYLHLDVLDGFFTDNEAFSYEEVNLIANKSKKPLMIHLMVNHPISYLKYIPNKESTIVIIHYENISQETIKAIEEKNFKLGIAINPATPVEAVRPYLNKIDLVLLMSVEPGFGGQPLIKEAFNKIKNMANLVGNLPIDIAVDGGINLDNKDEIIRNGATCLVVGSYITNQSNYEEAIKKLK